MTAAALYCRISSDREGAGLGVERQEQDCRELAARRGWTVAQVYVDNDLSAYSSRKARPGYQAMMEAAGRGDIQVIVAWHTDRLHRQPRELEEFIDLVERARVQVETVKAGVLDLSTPAGRMVARQLGAVARYESEHKAERQRRKQQQLAEAGKVSGGGNRPFGYADDFVTLVPAEAAAIREAVDRVLAGESLRAVVEDFDRRQVRTSRGLPWRKFNLRAVITSARVAGLRSHKGVVTGQAVWPAIITPAELERVRAALRYQGHVHPHENKPGRPRKGLTGFVYCGRCGQRMHRAGRRNAPFTYMCKTDPTRGCGLTINGPSTEAYVREAVLVAVERGDVVAALQAAQAGADGAELEAGALAQLQGVAERQSALAAMFADGALDPSAYQAATVALAAKRTEAEARLAGASRVNGRALALVADLAQLRDRWDALTDSDRRGVLELFVERINVAAGRRGTFQPERIGITWRA